MIFIKTTRLHLVFLLSMVYCLVSSAAYSQTKHCGSPVTELKAYKVQHFAGIIADAELKGYRLETGQFGLPPGGEDTISHRHDCELLVIVLSGVVEIAQNFQAPVTLQAGEVFYEERNVIHSSTRNPDKINPVNLLLVYIIKDGRQFYTRLFPEKK